MNSDWLAGYLVYIRDRETLSEKVKNIFIKAKWLCLLFLYNFSLTLQATLTLSYSPQRVYITSVCIDMHTLYVYTYILKT